MSDAKIDETDDVVINVLALIIGAMTVAEPNRQAGFDEALAHIRDHFLNDKKNKSAALTEQIRRRSTDNRSDPALLNILRAPPAGRA